MVINFINGDIFETKDRHIVFALNIEGINTNGFAARIAYLGFGEIFNTDGKNPYTDEDLFYREVLSKEIDGIIYHGIVCYSLQKGWSDADMYVLEALDELDVQEPMSIVVIGSDSIDQIHGAPVEDILAAYEKSNKQLNIYF